MRFLSESLVTKFSYFFFSNTALKLIFFKLHSFFKGPYFPSGMPHLKNFPICFKMPSKLKNCLLCIFRIFFHSGLPHWTLKLHWITFSLWIYLFMHNSWIWRVSVFFSSDLHSISFAKWKMDLKRNQKDKRFILYFISRYLKDIIIILVQMFIPK